MGADSSSFSFRKIRFTGAFTFNLLGVNYCVNLSLSNGLHIHTCYFAWTEKFNNRLCTHFWRLRGLKKGHTIEFFRIIIV